MNSSVTKAINLIEALSRSRKPLALKALAENTSLDKATAYRLLSSLRQKGLVQKIGEHGSYVSDLGS
jgi:DNA-binding IclR family transcriptional regulator